MTQEQIKEIIENFNSQTLPRLKRLKNYYSGNHDILNKTKDAGKPNNQLVNNFCKNITDTTVGYFMGTPVCYSSDREELIGSIRLINDYNDEQFINSRLSKDLSVYGVACELVYYDEDKMIRIAPCDVLSTIPVYSPSIDRELSAAIRIYELEDAEDEDTVGLEIYDSNLVSYYSYNTSSGEAVMIRSVPHYFGLVPINFYYNNSDKTGDFESVMTLVDAYNELQSESVNDFELFADSYLAVTGMNATDAEDIAKLRENRVLLIDEGGDAKWLTKSVNDAYIENLKKRISSDIYRFSGSVDMTDDAIGESASGVAIKYRLLNFENRVSVTERYFKKSLMRRYEMICNMLNTLGNDYSATEIRITFTRNIPENPIDNADYAQKMAGVVSRKTLLERIPFVDDVDSEMSRIREESINN
ncbi:MAG: phage portal protein [Clostridia bacterium]|nr:phage portal protein [Clostridia bacterium]MBO5416045.1 phage portal protein [Clostridia bacterium]